MVVTPYLSDQNSGHSIIILIDFSIKLRVIPYWRCNASKVIYNAVVS